MEPKSTWDRVVAWFRVIASRCSGEVAKRFDVATGQAAAMASFRPMLRLISETREDLYSTPEARSWGSTPR